MPIVKRAARPNIFSVFEDPRTSKNTVYLENAGHDASTLSPIYDLNLSTDTSLGRAGIFGNNNTDDAEISAGAPGTCLALTKQTTHVYHTIYSDNRTQVNLDYSWGVSMDPNNPYSQLKHWTDGNQNMVTYSTAYGYTEESIFWNSTQSDKELGDIDPSYSLRGAYPGNRESRLALSNIVYYDSSTQYISAIYRRIWGRSTNIKGPVGPSTGLARINQFPSYTDFSAATYRTYYIPQLIGISSNDSKPIYLLNYNIDDYNQIIIKHNLNDASETVLHTFSTVPAASGSNYGGARSTTTGLMRQNKIASQTFDDPSSIGNTGFYVPYFDTSNNYFPFFIQWDRSNDTFTRNEDVTISGDLSSTHMGTLHGILGVDTGFKSMLYNETFVFSGNRYVVLFPLEAGYRVNDATAPSRTFITYSVDAANPKSLTHHSAVTVPTTIHNVVWLNDARTQLGVICESAFYIYNFESVNGWTLTGTLPYQFWSVGRDSSDRIWAASKSTIGYTDIHLITPTIPINIVISSASESYDYQGTTIDTTLTINAYNTLGERVATSLQLDIDGNSMTFDDDSTTKVITTSDSADTSQDVKITGVGLSNVIASVVV